MIQPDRDRAARQEQFARPIEHHCGAFLREHGFHDFAHLEATQYPVQAPFAITPDRKLFTVLREHLRHLRAQQRAAGFHPDP